MNDPLNIIVVLAARRGRGLDQPDLADHLTTHNAWEAWTPVEGLLELPLEVEELIDTASADLGHFHPAGPQRQHAWECAQADAWGLARPVPRPILPTAIRRAQPAALGSPDCGAGTRGHGATHAATDKPGRRPPQGTSSRIPSEPARRAPINTTAGTTPTSLHKETETRMRNPVPMITGRQEAPW